MKKLLLICFTIVLSSSFNFAQDDVVLQFITNSGYSNNLYIDNVTAGNQFNMDAAVTSINNIDADTSYSIGSSSFIVAPQVTVTNLGKMDITTPLDVVIAVEPGGYTDIQSVPSLNSGQSTTVTFTDLTIVPETGIDITVTSQLAGDENPSNDTYSQYTMVLPGVQRTNVLLEEWTNASCPPCAGNNPTIDAFVEANFNSIVPIKYHVWWPGYDPMYQYNIPENTARTNYYGVGGVPHVIMGGKTHPVYPYTTPGSLQDGYDTQMSKATPLELSLTDTRIAGDSIRADITLTIHSPLIAGQYFLRVMAIERWIHYATAPGTNGETDFYDVFRKAYPDIMGTTIPTTPGTYNFSFTYALDMGVWVDSLIYTAAIVQDDATKKVWCSDKGRELPLQLDVVEIQETVSKPIGRKGLTGFGSQSLSNNLDNPLGGFNIELFEGTFPPVGWQVINPDGGVTFEQFEGANGPSLGGSKSVKMDFYNYPSIGASDTMCSRIFTGLQVTDSVKFDYAHAEYPGFGPDTLIVKASIDGGKTFPFTVFHKWGNDLATVPATTSEFVPANSSEWATFSFSLDTIVTFSSVSVQSPNGGEVWVVGETEDITWTSVSVDDIKIELSTDNGTTWSTIIESTPNTGTYAWVVIAQDSSDECLIKITNVANSFVNDVSDAVFTIDIVSSVKNDGEGIPTEFDLVQNYPNPFNPSTIIKYTVSEERLVSIKVFDLIGREVTTLVDEIKQPGSYEITFNAEKYASGVYLYQMISGDFVRVKKMSLLK